MTRPMGRGLVNPLRSYVVVVVSMLLCVPSPGRAQEEGTATAAVEKLSPQEMRERLEELELQVLMLQAGAAQGAPEADEVTLKSFQGGQRSLQALNPEISVVGDLFGRYVDSGDGRGVIGGERSGAFLRVLGLHLQSNLDPFAFAKMAVELHPDGAEVGEAYVTWTAVLPGLSLTFGKFRQQLGVVNRWHTPGLDQFDFPLMLTVPFGPEGLNQSGLAAHLVLPPVWSHGLELFVQVTNGSNGGVFAGEFFSVPSTLVRLTNYWDLTPNTYLELGLTGMFGFNNPRSALGDDGDLKSEPWRHTIIGGADLTLNWEPLNRSKYHYLTWRTEFLYIRKQLVEEDVLQWMGGYTSLEFKINRSWIIGVREDLVQPFNVEHGERWIVQTVPYVSWWQSPWVRLRLEYDLTIPEMDVSAAKIADVEHRVFLQFTFAAGPHKHERY
ncbi:MAG: hypothetical protein ABIK09_05470 [Pseudomonadota bacterium]